MSGSTRKQVVARPVSANLGRQRKYLRKINALRRKSMRQFLRDLLDYLGTGVPLAQDESLTNPPKGSPDAGRLDLIKRRIEASIKANPDAFRADLDGFIARNMSRWTWLFNGKEMRKVAEWYARNCAYDVSAAQRRAFMAAGMSEEVFRERWTIPLVGRYISREAENLVPDLIEQNVNLITKMSMQDLARARKALMGTITGETTTETFFRVLEETQGFDTARAERVVRDQTHKMSQTVQRENAKALDIKTALWEHHPGQYSSREQHVEMNGKEFDLGVGLYDRVEHSMVLPGVLPFCQCVASFVIPRKYRGVPD